MKIGLRTPNLKKRLKARTTGKLKRKMKKSINPLYGKKGMGLLHPKRALYNKVYNKTTFGVGAPKVSSGKKRKASSRKRTSAHSKNYSVKQNSNNTRYSNAKPKSPMRTMMIVGIVIFVAGLITMPVYFSSGILAAVIGAVLAVIGYRRLENSAKESKDPNPEMLSDSIDEEPQQNT